MESKLDLALLKKLVSELETTLTTAYNIRDEKDNANINNFVIEMAKASGLCAGVAQEASLLVGDIQSLVRVSQSPSNTKLNEFLKSLESPPKGSGNPDQN